MIRPTLFAFALLAVPGSAFAQLSDLQPAETAAFVDFKTAEALDDKCHFFKHFERVRVWELEEGRLEPLALYSYYQSGKITEEEYQAERTTLLTRAKDAAAAIACTDTDRAAPLIVPIRTEIAADIYADLLIAFSDQSLSPERQNAARAFEAMIYPLYGEANWTGFVNFAGSKAQRLMAEAQEEDAIYDPFYGLDLGGLGGNGGFAGIDGLVTNSAETPARDALISFSTSVADRILFEMVAEQFGYRRFEKFPGKGYAYRDQLTDFAFNPVMDIWENPALFETLDTGTPFYATFTVATDGAVRVMTYGQGAASLAGDGTLTVLVNNEIPADVDRFFYVRGPEWWANAQRFEGTLVKEPCLGGPCFSLPDDILETILAGGASNEFRFFFTSNARTGDPEPKDPRVHSGYGYKLDYRNQMIALGL